MRVTILVAILLAGCLQPEEGPRPEVWGLPGGWSADRTQADIEAVCEIVREHNPNCPVMESFPEQFNYQFPSQRVCEDARAKILRVPHTTAGACRGPIA